MQLEIGATKARNAADKQAFFESGAGPDQDGEGSRGGGPPPSQKSIKATLKGGGGGHLKIDFVNPIRGGEGGAPPPPPPQPFISLIFRPLKGRSRFLTQLNTRENSCKRQLSRAPRS